MILAKYNHFLFDLDGTLIDSFGDIQYSLEMSYKRVLGRDIKIERRHIGPPLVEMIDEISPELGGFQKEAVIKEFRNIYDNSSYELTYEMNGAIQLLLELKAQKKELYLVTNKSLKPTCRIIRKLKIDLFADVVTPDRIGGKRLNKSELIQYLIQHYTLDITKTVMIGDTAHDAIAAARNMIDSIAVAEGYDTSENLRRANPTCIVGALTELQTRM